jgi:hypothetical protein
MLNSKEDRQMVKFPNESPLKETTESKSLSIHENCVPVGNEAFTLITYF